MSEANTDTGITSTGNTLNNIEDTTNAFAAFLSGEEPGNREDSEAQADEAIEVEAEAEESEELEAEAETDLDDEVDDREEEVDSPVYTVKVDGEEIEVPIDELLNGYSRTQDYTRKTQKLAEERKAAMAEIDNVRQERAQYSQLLDVMRQQIEGNQANQVDWDRLRSEDPIEYSVQWAEHQRQQERLQAVRAEQQRLAEIQQQEQLAQVEQTVQKERELLVQAIPEWSKAETAQSEKAGIRDFAKRVGFTEQEVASIVDHRAVVMLRNAYLYDKLMSNKGQVKPVQKSASPVMRPGSANTAPKPSSDLSKAKQRLAKTGSLQDAAAAFSLLLEKG